MTVAFAEFAAGQRPESIPAKALAAARMGMTDLVGCMFAGLEQPAVKAIRGALLTVGVLNEARICLGAERASSPEAALAMTAAGGVLDFDDVALKGSHPSSILTAALLCEAERIGASGRDVVAAYATGFEVWARVIDREADPYIEKGWHTTSVIGPLAATAALANLCRLTAAEATNAIGIAAATSAGLVASFGTFARPFQAGRAAQSAVLAVRMAKSGITGGKTAIEAANGLLTALSPRGRVDLETPMDDLGKNWRLETGALNLKKYPMALATHRAFDGMQDLVAAHGLKLDEVVAVRLFIGPEQAEYRRRLAPPGAPFRALTSVELGLAAVLCDGGVALEHLEKPFYARPDVQAFMAKVSSEVDGSIGPDVEINLGFAKRLVVQTTDGRTLESGDAPVPSGNWRLPMSLEEQWQKFSKCSAGQLSEAKSRALFDALQHLDAVASVRDLAGAA